MAPEALDKTKKEPMGEVIDLLLSDSDSDSDYDGDKENAKAEKKPNDSTAFGKDKDNGDASNDNLPAYKKILAKTATNAKKAKATNQLNARAKTTTSLGLQAGLVLEEDIFAADKTNDQDGDRKTPPDVLFEDPEFGPMASSIQGMHKASIADAAENETAPKWRPKCRCSLLSTLSYNKDGRPYFSCGKHSSGASNGRKCNFFSWAFRAELTPWYRFGSHNGHVLVHKDLVGVIADASSSTSTPSIFSAQDLVQGKVGDCWFLSALAVVAERSDLVGRLFRRKPGRLQNDHEDEQRGIVRVNLFLDGIWTPVTIDNFLPCSLGGNQKEEEELQKAIEASLLDQSSNSTPNNIRNPYAKPKATKLSNQYNTKFPRAASGNEPHGVSETNLSVMRAAFDFLQKDFARRRHSGQLPGPQFLPEGKHASTSDLAYSKTRRNQLWVPFLEKAYAKIHGSYQAISGGHVAEAFLDLTGAPTLQVVWHAGRAAAARNSSVYDDPRKLWQDLKGWRRKRLPMGCGTDRSAGGLIGMHAYSILDVVELTNVDVEFFRERLLNGTLGNVSGFTEYDGKLRLLRVRNPHGQGEWKGEFSDKCKTWQKLLMSSGISLPRTMANDGTFWIGYDDFLLGFSNIDVVLAFEGNHAKSFVSNFPPKKCNHRCQKAFEVSLLDPQPGLETKDRVEVYVMGIQKSKRGARQGRVDRKKSYKVSDLGIIVGEYPLDETGKEDGKDPFSTIHGQMFGFNRNGHYKLILDRKKCKRLVVMPISFGHPAATDEFRSFVVRFNADAPLMIRELEHTPRMDRVLGRFLMSPKPPGHLNNTRQGMQYILWKNAGYKVTKIDCLGNGGGTVFVYLCRLADTNTKDSSADGSATNSPITLGIEATCRGMSCRVAEGLLDHETTAKGKKFQASWRKYTTNFVIEARSNIQSRLLMVLYQSGQDTEMGTITCKSMGHVLGSNESNETTSTKSTTLDEFEEFWGTKKTPIEDMDYKELGVFNPISMNNMDFRKSRWGSNDIFESKVDDREAVHVQKHLEDEELEMALALSRMDPAVNANSNLSTEDAELQKALAISCEDTEMAKTNTVIDLENDGETIIKASKTRESNKSVSTIDLTADAEVDASSTNNGITSNKNSVVLDLTDSQLEVVPTICNVENNTTTVLDLIDSSDDEDGESTNEPKVDSEATHNADHSSKKRGSPMENESNIDSREKKRKLAAEAALRRMKK